MKTAIYNIPNISCGHCVNTIQLELSDLEGIDSVEASAENKTAIVTFDQPATDEKIRALLAEINYPAES